MVVQVARTPHLPCSCYVLYRVLLVFVNPFAKLFQRYRAAVVFIAFRTSSSLSLTA